MMHDLDGYNTLRSELDALNTPMLLRRQQEEIGKYAEGVGKGLRAIHRFCKPVQPKTHDLDNYYLVPLQRQMGELSQTSFPSLKRFIHHRL